MRGESLDDANMGWHGLEGDRRLAFRRAGNQSGFPWLTASKFPDLIRYAPRRHSENAEGELPTHIQLPDGEEFPIFSEELAAEVGRRFGAPVEMMQLKQGIFDDATISVISTDTVRQIGHLADVPEDARRFRPNIVIRLVDPAPFQEDGYVGKVLTFGGGDDAPAIVVSMRDKRCSMIGLEPDSALSSPEVLKSVVRVNETCAGIYCAVTRIGRLHAGQPIYLR